MNDQDNIGLIRKIYAAFGTGDVQTILDSVADGADWINHGPVTVPYAGSRSGKPQILEFFQAIADSTTGGKVIADNFIAQGDAVVALGVSALKSSFRLVLSSHSEEVILHSKSHRSCSRDQSSRPKSHKLSQIAPAFA